MVFERELNLIKDDELRELTRSYMEEKVAPYFYTIGGALKSIHHPIFDHGEGGLVRHTKAVVMFAESLLELSSYKYLSDTYKDFVICACIVHDTCKYGVREYAKEEYADHARNAAKSFRLWGESKGYQVSEYLLSAIRCHMGQWSEPEDRPFTTIDRVVHLADYLASRTFIDIPFLHDEDGVDETI